MILAIVCFLLSFVLATDFGGLNQFVLETLIVIVGMLLTGGLLGWGLAEDRFHKQLSPDLAASKKKAVSA